MDTYKSFALWLQGVLDMNDTLTKEQHDKIREKLASLDNANKSATNMRC